MLAAIHLLIICWLIFKIKKFQISNISVVISIAYFIVKCCFGFSLWLIYRDYYKQGDMLEYWHDTNSIFIFLKNSPIDFFKSIIGISQSDILNNMEHWNAFTYNPYFNDNRTFLIFNLLIRMISFGDVYVQIIWINFAAYFGLLCLYNCFIDEYHQKIDSEKLHNNSTFLKFIPFLLPSVLIFGSALSKESLWLFVFGILIRNIQVMYNNYSIRNVVYFIVSSAFVFAIKSYLFLALLPGLFALVVIKKMSDWNFKWIFISIYVGGLIELLIIGKFFPQYDLPSYLFGQRLNLLRNAVFSGADSLINPVCFAPEALSFLKRIPQSILFAFVNPLQWELKSFWMLPISWDSVIIIFVMAYLFIFRKVLTIFDSPFSLLFLFISLLLLMAIGFTIPVIGNLVRFKMPAMFMLAISVCFVKKRSIN